jgi:hypothetical protein
MADRDREKLVEMLQQLDDVDINKLTLDDIKAIRSPTLARFLNEFVSGQLQRASGHTSHLDHLSHYSSAARIVENPEIKARG